ncbi:TPA: 30S ribosomal protein S15 [Candidatus Woesearchaeota archaeon]|nr:30S ribosomal protein S15 [Candidatus Woesearchaeota archaeon]HIH42088.1 30S ribosomal protein S15 [Candidatus Woesearchaeota archaeon]
MAKMHSRARGRSQSTKPSKITQKAWVRYGEKEIELLILKLAKEGQSPSQIGLHLRDTYGIPSVRAAIGRKVSKVLAEKSLLKELPEDLMALIRRDVQIRKHLEKNKHDQPARRGLNLTESKIKRLVKYYKETARLSEEWKYDADKVKLYVQ